MQSSLIDRVTVASLKSAHVWLGFQTCPQLIASLQLESRAPHSASETWMQVPTKKILIIYDDLDTPLASVRLKQKGGHGGHNGIRSLGSHLKGDFPRIKIGRSCYSWL